MTLYAAPSVLRRTSKLRTPAPPESVAESPSVARSPAVVAVDGRLTPVRSETLGVPATGADRSMRTLAAFTWLLGPQFPTASATVPPFRPRFTVPALQPVSVTVQLAPLPAGVPIWQPVAVPVRAKSPDVSNLIDPPNVSRHVSDVALVGEPGR